MSTIVDIYRDILLFKKGNTKEGTIVMYTCRPDIKSIPFHSFEWEKTICNTLHFNLSEKLKSLRL